MIVATIAILILYFGGGGGAFSFEKAFEPFLKEVIAEEARRDQAIQLTKAADKDVQQFRTEVTEVWAKDLKAIVADYDATDADFHAFYEKGALSRTSMQQKMLDIRFDLVRLMTPDEWSRMQQMIAEKAEANQKKADEQKK